MASLIDKHSQSKSKKGFTEPTISDDAVVKPVKGKRAISSDSPVVLVGTFSDLNNLVQLMSYTSVPAHPLFNSRLYQKKNNRSSAVIIGPIVGAPYAAMVLETLVVWGGRQFLFLGWCGALSVDVKIGDLIIPERAIIDEGTSKHYMCTSLPSDVSYPTTTSLERIHRQLNREKIDFHPGAVWTTDAIFRETPDKINHFRSQGASAVDMETSALFSIASYRGVELGAILVVSDELSTFKWAPGFKTEAFAAGRSLSYEVIRRVCLPTPIPKSSRKLKT
jgi:uridine phosphorylase